MRSGVPVLASRIDGNVGLLGADYDGYFPVGDAAALAALARRFCADAAFAARLRAQCAAREPLFRPAAERARGARPAWPACCRRDRRALTESRFARPFRSDPMNARPSGAPLEAPAASPDQLLARRRLRLQDRARACSRRSCARAAAASSRPS